MAIISKPADYSSVTAAVWSILNTLKNTIYDEFNGNIDNANIKSAAAIAPSKIADTAVVCGNTVAPGTQTITRPTVFTDLTVGTGTGAGTSLAGGLVTVNTTAVSTPTTGEDDLMTYTLVANTLTTTGRGIKISAWGSTVNNANAKLLRLKIGGTLMHGAAFTLEPSTPGFWKLDAIVLRTGASTQDVMCTLIQGSGAFSTYGTHLPQTVTETVANIIKITADGGTIGDVTQEGFLIEYL